MKKLITLVTTASLIFINTSCRSADKTGFVIPPTDMEAVERAVQKFSQEFNVFVDSTVYFDDSSYEDLSTSGTGTLGKCIVQTNHIIIDKRFWDDAPSSVREALLFHELGHCMLGLGHDNVRGIMSSFIGHNANSFAYEFQEGIEYMKQMPCEFGCDLDRIITNRGEHNAKD